MSPLTATAVALLPGTLVAPWPALHAAALRPRRPLWDFGALSPRLGVGGGVAPLSGLCCESASAPFQYTDGWRAVRANGGLIAEDSGCRGTNCVNKQYQRQFGCSGYLSIAQHKLTSQHTQTHNTGPVDRGQGLKAWSPRDNGRCDYTNIMHKRDAENTAGPNSPAPSAEAGVQTLGMKSFSSACDHFSSSQQWAGAQGGTPHAVPQAPLLGRRS